MKKQFLLISCLGAITIAFAGCAPQLARTKYGPEEQQWKSYINKSYKDWEPPPTPPPYKEGASSNNNKSLSSIEIVPEPSNSPEKINVFEDAKPISINPQESKTYIVKKGDTLWSISYKFYNDGKSWKKIQDANMGKLKNPKNLKAGMILTIPAEQK
ncbi:MAG: LysM peptidoglycan-binding domain-containing protein [bacterium]|nr:LysM peptidoglycan-binding domain-containing protein [bacterium]